MKIEHENSFKAALANGINLFVGAGFSINAEDTNHRELPTGATLLTELQSYFKVKYAPLAQCCSYLNRMRNQDYKRYLIERFTISKFPSYYENICLMKIKNIFTTNIDNLIPTIYDKSNQTEGFLNDKRTKGASMSEEAVNYLPLHGNVDTPEEEFIMGMEQLANVYNSNSRAWSFLSHSIEAYPTLFLGYSYSDYSTIQAFTSTFTLEEAQKPKWILLFNPDEETIEFYRSLNFNVIEGNIEEFLKALPSLLPSAIVHKSTNRWKTLLGNYLVPTSRSANVQRPINEYLLGNEPIWSDIHRNVIHIRKNEYQDICDSIHGEKNTLILGAPISGKTTLGMQVAVNIDFPGEKLYIKDLSKNHAEYICKLIGTSKVLIFVENFTNDIEALNYICSQPNIKVVGIDQSYFYEQISNQINKSDFDIIDVTKLQSIDIDPIYQSIPTNIRKDFIPFNSIDNSFESIYEFISRHIVEQTLSERYKTYINKLTTENTELAEFLVLSAYMNSSRVALSLEAAASYFSDEFNYYEVKRMQEKLHDELRELDVDWPTEVYSPRSNYLAKSILESAPLELRRDVMWNVVDCIHPMAIYNFDVFRKFAFDKDLTIKVFVDYREGKKFYEAAIRYCNDNPYIYQQGALYLANKGQYADAFNWIEYAYNHVKKTSYSIENSRAIIQFSANYGLNNDQSKLQLENSMDRLFACHERDMRKTFHAIIYADQAIKYYKKYNNEQAILYLENAKSWLNEESKRKIYTYTKRVYQLLKEVNDILENN